MADTARQALGRAAEALAAEHLRACGYAIEAVNARFPVGEIDIVARDGSTLCFVEVRSVSSRHWGGALASITEAKRRRLVRAARRYLARRGAAEETRFDVVTVEWTGPAPAVELVRSAFFAD